MKKIFEKRDLFLILLPFFFLLHGFNENYGFVDARSLLLLLVYCVTGTAVIYFITYLLIRNRLKTSLFVFCLLTVFLFYGAVQDFFKLHLRVASKYSVLLSAFILLLTVLFLYLKKTKQSFGKLVLFLNVLMGIYLLIDMVAVVKKIIVPPVNPFSVYPLIYQERYKPIETAGRPDVYFLLFDEYASSASLKENYDFLNPLDSFLMSRGFAIQKKATSNYHFTWVSLASILNMSYLNGMSPDRKMTADDINNSLQLIKNNAVINLFSQQGYTFANFSHFDIAGNPSHVNQAVLPVKARLISDKTLLARMDRDMGWMTAHVDWLNTRKLYDGVNSNNKLIDLAKTFSTEKRKLPVFVYLHVLMPHFPFYYASDGRLKSKAEILDKNATDHQNTEAYLQYLQYANTRIMGIIDTIQSNTAGKAAIVLMGDHGYRHKIDQNLIQNFQVMNAVYLPGKDYHLFYDSISAVNQFRVVFNSLFKQSIPLLKDTTVFLSGKGVNLHAN